MVKRLITIKIAVDYEEEFKSRHLNSFHILDKFVSAVKNVNENYTDVTFTEARIIQASDEPRE